MPVRAALSRITCRTRYPNPIMCPVHISLSLPRSSAAKVFPIRKAKMKPTQAWKYAAAVALVLAISASASDIPEILRAVQDDTGFDPSSRFGSVQDGIQHLYLHVLRSVHKRHALPFHTGDLWGTKRGGMIRASIHKFLGKEAHRAEPGSRLAAGLTAAKTCSCFTLRAP